MPKEALVKTLEKLLEPVSGKSVYLTANDLLAVWDFFDIDRTSLTACVKLVPFPLESRFIRQRSFFPYSFHTH